MKQYKFTIFTPTYNRRELLHRVFESLQEQTLIDFQWIIVDDGSIDNTDEIVNKFKRKSNFDIEYYYKKNGGKHKAINYALTKAKGELFLIFDSDDYCTNNSLEIFYNYWKEIKTSEANIKSIASLSIDTKKNIIGDSFPKDEFVSNFIDIKFKYEIAGDKWILVETDYFKKFKFPEFENEKFIAESSVWLSIGKETQTLFVNNELLIHEYQETGLSANTIKLRKSSPYGTSYTYLQELGLNITFKYKIKAAINLFRFSYVKPTLFIQNILKVNPFLTIVALPISLLFIIKDNIK